MAYIRSLFNRFPILLPANVFTLCWVPYLVVFFRNDIAFGSFTWSLVADPLAYWTVFGLQLGVCVISHSLTLRTIIRLHAPLWLIIGSLAFFALSPAWGLMTAVDFRHPAFAAVFCVFVSSLTFMLIGKHTPRWLWIQIVGATIAVSLLRADGALITIPALVLLVVYKLKSKQRLQKNIVEFTIETTPAAHKESRNADVCAAYLIACALILFTCLTVATAHTYTLTAGDFGAATSSYLTFFGNLTGTNDVVGIIPASELIGTAHFQSIATSASLMLEQIQCLPLLNLTFSWVAFDLLFLSFLAWGLSVCLRNKRHDIRALLIALPMIVVVLESMLFTSDATLRFIMPVLAAQPMFFASVYFIQNKRV